MLDPRAAELIELAATVLSPLPCDAVSPSLGDPARRVGVHVKRRQDDRLVAYWRDDAPGVGDAVESHLASGEAAKAVSGRVTSTTVDMARLVEVTARGPRRQRRTAPRGGCDELILISQQRDINAELVDVSATGIRYASENPIDRRVANHETSLRARLLRPQ
jgi:hypothetical protein